ncbi:hypothetical protein M9Y10_020115 [Tritrichomonas musculus]|uniref:Uncharacterized protein n=1 Tax=Tritrichomonas musculus TaxID=1915356 RepID=A0ABR2HF91_9EUKA
MKKAASRASFKNPNLLNYPEKNKSPNFHITFSNLQSSQKSKTPTSREFISSKEVSLIKPSSARTASATPVRIASTNYISPVRTKIFDSLSAIENYYNMQQISQINSQAKTNYQEIFFSNPLSDSLFSSILVAFITSYFELLSQFIDITQDGEVSLEQSLKALQHLTFETITNQISDFISLFKSMNISITGPMYFDSLSDLEVILQAEFEKNQTEDVIISCNIDEIAPNLIKVKSSIVQKFTGQQLAFEYNLRWAIAMKGEKYFPIIFRKDFVADVLYQCTLSHLFGSMSAVFYSGAKINLLCYSLRPNDCPLIRIHND